MLSLFRFLYKHAFIVYFLILEIISFAFLLQKNPFQRASFLNSSDYLVASTYNAYDNVLSYLNLGEVNEYLSQENSHLKSNSIEYFRKSFDNNVIYRDSSYEQEFIFYGAKIIRNSTSRRNNYFTINKGEMNGIEKGMGVVSNKGVMGIVIETSKRFSAVMSILNKDFKLSGKMEKNGYFGSIIWPGTDYRLGRLLDIPNHVSLVQGDLVVTSGYSGVFPAGLPVGRVKAVERRAGSGFLEVDIEFTEDYRKASYVHVVKYLHHIEREKLESLIPQND
jgi:rod shape-determining protein MreC